MQERPRERSFLTVILVSAVLILMLPLAAYIAGYFWLPAYDATVTDDGTIEDVSRDYPHEWQTNIYQPAGKLESWLRRIPVFITGPDGGML